MHRKRRIRKKRRQGEFRRWGCEVCVDHVPGTPLGPLDAFIGDLIAYVEARDLCVGGGGAGRMEFVVARAQHRRCEGPRRAYASVTPDEVDALVAWCRARPDVEFAAANEWLDISR